MGDHKDHIGLILELFQKIMNQLLFNFLWGNKYLSMMQQKKSQNQMLTSDFEISIVLGELDRKTFTTTTGSWGIWIDKLKSFSIQSVTKF